MSTGITQKKSLKEIIADEYKKCAVDPIHFMKKYCMIQHPVRGKIPFHLFPFQEQTLTQFKDNRFNIVLKSRQTGISTLSAGYALWKMIFNTDFNVLVIATKQDVAKNLVTKVRVMHELLPSWLKGGSLEDNKLSLRLNNGSQIKAIASSPDAGRSEALSLLIFDEAAFIDDIDEIWVAAQSTLSTGGSCIALSTPNGVGNWFHKTWLDAEEGTNPFNTIRLHWTVHPELLMFYKETYCQNPIEKTGFDGNLWRWEYPTVNGSYMVVADVARGDGADFSGCHVLDVQNATQVAEYKGKIDTKDFGNFLVNLSTEYNDALLVIENSNIGWACIQQCIDRDYKNLFYMSKDLKYVDVEQQMKNKYRADERQMVAGFSTTSKTRPLIISKLDEYFREKSVTIRSNRLIDELFTFIFINGRAEAMKGYNDDLTMALSIGLWVRDTALRLRQEGIDLTKRTLGGISSNMQHAGVYGPADRDDNPWKMKIGDDFEDLTQWL